MADEKLFTIPLRKEFSKVASYKKTPRAVKEIRKFISKHMKVENVKIGKHLNKKMWKDGIKSPPPRVKVKAIKEEDFVRVELPEFEFDKKKEEVKKGVKERLQEKMGLQKGVEASKSSMKEEKLVKEGKVETKEPDTKPEMKKEDNKQVEEKIRSEHIVTETGKTKIEKTRP